MAYANPSVSTFQNFFSRDFAYGTTSDVVNSSDIQNAITLAGINFAQGLWATQQAYTTGYLYLTAHFLVMNLRASSQGIAGNYTWLTNSKGVGTVNESYQIPQRILDNPAMAMYSKTYYGAQYLNMVLPQIVGQMFTSFGPANP